MNRSEEAWQRWADLQPWKPLPKVQEQRHRRSDGSLFVGSGYNSLKYQEVAHENMNVVPSWRLRLVATMKCVQFKIVRRTRSSID